MKKIYFYIFLFLALAVVAAVFFMNQSSPELPTSTPNTEPILESTAPAIEPAEPTEAKFSFTIIGDTQRFAPDNSAGGFQRAVESIATKNVDLVMTVGDLVSSCGWNCDEKLVTWQSVLGELAGKTYAVMGNHDRTWEKISDSAWQKTFKSPTNGPGGYEELTYAFDFQNSHFVVLNSEKPKGHIINKTQRDWLERDLAANTKENVFVFFHEPAYPVSSKIDESLDAHEDERDALWQILAEHEVTAVFNGHEHIYSRRKIDGVYQFVFGNTDAFDHDLPAVGVAEFSYQGKSFGLVEVVGTQIVVNLYAVDGKLLDSFSLPDKAK